MADTEQPGYPERVATRNRVGVHAARSIPIGDARGTACGETVDRRYLDLDPGTEVTCWGCRQTLKEPTDA